MKRHSDASAGGPGKGRRPPGADVDSAVKDRIRKLRDRARERTTTDEHLVVGVIKGWIRKPPAMTDSQTDDPTT